MFKIQNQQIYLLNIRLYQGVPLLPLLPLDPFDPLDPVDPVELLVLDPCEPPVPLVENELVDDCLTVPIPTLPLVVDVPIPIDIK